MRERAAPELARSQYEVIRRHWRTNELNLCVVAGRAITDVINIIYDYQVFGWQQYGGISRYFHELAKRIEASEGFSASVLAPLHVNRYLRLGGVKVSGLLVPTIPKTNRLIAMTNRCLSKAKLQRMPPDVIHETYYRSTPITPPYCPVVITVHDMIHEKFPGDFGRRDPTSQAKRAAVARADQVICVSERTRQDLIELFNPNPAKVHTIYHGFDLQDIAEPIDQPDITRPFFLYVGQRGGYKNFSRLLSAYASSRALRNEFDLIAFGAKSFTPLERSLIHAAALDTGQVRHLAGDDGLLSFLYRRATALVYPSLYEGFGIPPLEAMSLSCPVLCSRTSSLPEIVGDAGLYFDPSNVDEIAAAMETVASSSAVRQSLIIKGGTRVREFSYERCASETQRIYLESMQ